MKQTKGFKLTKEQKIAFGELAIKQLTNANPQFPTDLAVDEIGETNIIFSNHGHAAKHQSSLVFMFDYCGMDAFCYLNGKPSANYSDAIRPLYLAYMCQTFGEPYREQTLAYWQQRAAEEYSEYRKHKARELTTLTNKLDQEEKALMDNHNNILDTLTGKVDQKLTHFAAPDLKPNTATQDTTPTKTPDREK